MAKEIEVQFCVDVTMYKSGIPDRVYSPFETGASESEVRARAYIKRRGVLLNLARQGRMSVDIRRGQIYKQEIVIEGTGGLKEVEMVEAS